MARIHPPGTILKIQTDTMALRTSPLPSHGFMVRFGVTEDLYRAEERVVNVLKQAAREMGRLHGWNIEGGPGDFYDKAVPASLVAALDSFSPSISVPAAVAYLQHHGIAVEIARADGDQDDAK